MPRQIGGVLARIEYLPISAFVRMLAATPLERAVRVGASLGSLAMRLDIRNRSIALKNLEIAFPQLDREARLKILTEMYRNLGRMMAEWTHLSELSTDNIGKLVSYEGAENMVLPLKLAEKRGGIIVSAHFGNFELMAAAHSLHGHRMAIVNRALRNPLIDRDVQRIRARFGNELVERKNAGPTILKFLRDKREVAVLLDLDVRDGVFVDFFGMQASTSDGVARIAMATGVPVVPAFIVREGGGVRHKIVVMPMIEIVKTRDRVESARENTQRMTAAIEKMIRRHPDHWNWIHRRWKTRPSGEKRFY